MFWKTVATSLLLAATVTVTGCRHGEGKGAVPATDPVQEAKPPAAVEGTTPPATTPPPATEEPPAPAATAEGQPKEQEPAKPKAAAPAAGADSEQ